MAARRLILAMLGLLLISIAISILVPNPGDRADRGTTATTGATSTTGAPGSTGATGSTGNTGPERSAVNDHRSLVTTVRVAAARPHTPSHICARPGQHVVLTVVTGGPFDVAIPGLGLTATTTRYAPAVFDVILPLRPGYFPVTDLRSGRRLAGLSTENACSA